MGQKVEIDMIPYVYTFPAACLKQKSQQRDIVIRYFYVRMVTMNVLDIFPYVFIDKPCDIPNRKPTDIDFNIDFSVIN